jgi:ABC-2 type transport system permease protein
LKDILLFELRYQASQRTFPLALAAFFAFGLLFTSSGFGPENVHLLSPWLVAETVGFLSLFAVFPAAIFTSQAALRDDEAGMADLVFATPISKSSYLGSRYAGALLAALAAICLGAAGMIAGAFLGLQPAERVGSLDPAAFPLALLLIALPAIAFSTALLFALAIATRSSLASAVGSLALYFLYFGAAAATSSPLLAASAAGDGGALAAAAWLDPFGLSSFFSHTLHWTADQKNTLLPYGGVLLVNRLATLGLAAFLLHFAWRSFRFEHGSTARATALAGSAGVPPAFRKKRAERPRLQQNETGFSADSPWASKAWLELRHLAAGWPLRVAFAMWLLLAATEIWSNLFQGEYGSAMLAIPGEMTGRIDEPFQLFGLVLLVYFGTELLWLEQAARMDAVTAATPVRGGALAFAKWLVLAVLVLALGLATVLLGVAIQLVRGYFHFEPAAYLAFLLTSCLPLLVVAAASVFLHRLARNRYLGLFAGMLLAFLVVMGRGLGLEHNLLRFAGAPPVDHSRLAGFGAALAPAAAFLLYWSLAGLLLVLVAAAIWRRDERPDWRAWRRPLSLAALAWLAAGAAIFTGTNLLGPYETAEHRLAWRADYEKKYADLASRHQPIAWHLQAKVALHPEERRAVLEGARRLSNQSREPIPTVWVDVPRVARVLRLASPQASKIELDERFQVYRLELDEPLPPGGGMDLEFALEVAGRAIENDAPDFDLVENGSYLALWRFLPGAGYRQEYEITDPRERQRRGLEKRLAPAEGEAEGAEKTTFEIEASTTEDQIAVGPGRLVRSWREGGRAHFLYDSNSLAASNALAIASARYRVERRAAARHEVEVYHGGRQPESARQVAAIAAASLDHFAAIFARPFPYDTLRLTELPRFWRFGGFATPASIFLVENRTFELDLRREASVDLLTRRVAHEVAHQWWGHGLTPNGGPGAVVLVESLAKYSELEMVEKLRGKEAARRLLDYELGRYLAERAGSVNLEVPLAQAENDAFLFYRKGALVMSAIEAALGREAFRAALAALLQKEAPRVEDLIAELEARAEPAGKKRIDELMRRIVLWDFELVEATSDLKLEIEARKWQADGSGREEEQTFEQEIEIAIEYEGGEEIHRVKLVPGRNTIELKSGTTPRAIQLDPNLLFIDKARWNNHAFI